MSNGYRPDPDEPHIMWKDGRRYVLREDTEPVRFEGFVVEALQTLLKETKYLRAMLDETRGLVP